MVGRKRKLPPNFVPAPWYSGTSDSGDSGENEQPLLPRRRPTGVPSPKVQEAQVEGAVTSTTPLNIPTPTTLRTRPVQQDCDNENESSESYVQMNSDQDEVELEPDAEVESEEQDDHHDNDLEHHEEEPEEHYFVHDEFLDEEEPPQIPSDDQFSEDPDDSPPAHSTEDEESGTEISSEDSVRKLFNISFHLIISILLISYYNKFTGKFRKLWRTRIWLD